MKRYDKEFKKNAVSMLVMGDKPLTVLAKELGISDVSLRMWRDRYLEEGDRHLRGKGCRRRGS